MIRRIFTILMMSASMGFGLGFSTPTAWACDGGSYYDPSHQICQNTPPAYTPPGYGWPPQNGGSNYGPSYPSQFGH